MSSKPAPSLKSSTLPQATQAAKAIQSTEAAPSLESLDNNNNKSINADDYDDYELGIACMCQQCRRAFTSPKRPVNLINMYKTALSLFNAASPPDMTDPDDVVTMKMHMQCLDEMSDEMYYKKELQMNERIERIRLKSERKIAMARLKDESIKSH